MGPGPSSPRLCQVLVEDPDLAEAVPPERRGQALEDCLAPEITIEPGPWANQAPLAADAIGYLILRGMVLRRVEVDGRFAVELVGESDLVRPWQMEDAQTLVLRAGWLALEPTTFALLDGRFTGQLGRYPELAARLFERAIRRSRRLVVNMAIIHQARVDERLHLLFWHFAGRWGRVRPDGVMLPLRLTHTVLADLVAARRPTVTSALSDLNKRGLIENTEEGWLLLGDPPGDITSLEKAQRAGDALAGQANARTRGRAARLS